MQGLGGGKIVFISDTHGNHSNLNIPKADFLVHFGVHARVRVCDYFILFKNDRISGTRIF